MLARAQGEAGSSATPRLPSWFERTPEESVEEPARSAPAESQPQPSRDAAPPRPVAARPDGTPITDRSVAPHGDLAAAHHTGPRQPLAGQPPTAGESELPRSAATPEPVSPYESRRSAAPATVEATPRPASAPVAAPPRSDAAPVPAVPRPPEPNPAPTDAERPAQPQERTTAPDVVEVAIGRIDVRATIARPPAPPVRQAAPDAPSRPVLSLADYLAGKREAQ